MWAREHSVNDLIATGADVTRIMKATKDDERRLNVEPQLRQRATTTQSGVTPVSLQLSS
jgi:hypothetical protein